MRPGYDQINKSLATISERDGVIGISVFSHEDGADDDEAAFFSIFDLVFDADDLHISMLNDAIKHLEVTKNERG